MKFTILIGVLSAIPVFGQSAATNIAINTTTILQPSVKRMGINLGTLTNYDSGQMLKNLIVGNPGFEGQTWNSTIRCAAGTAQSCTDEDIYSAWPANFWAGATYQIFYGTAAGRSGTVIGSSAAGNGQGVVLNFGDSGTAPAAGDYLILHHPIPGGAAGGWQTSVYGNGTVGDNLTDLPSGTPGTQTVVLNAPTSNDLAKIQTAFDSTNTMSFVQLNGTYQLQFQAKGLGTQSQVFVQLTRGTGTPFISEIVNLSSGWNTYNLTFTAAENGTAVGTVALGFSTIYAPDEFELDNVSLTKTNGDATNPTVFRDSVVNALRALQPGEIRYWGGNGQLGETLDNLLTPQLGRQRAGFTAFSSQSTIVDYGLHEFLVLCQTVGAEPWFVVPSTFTYADAANLMEYLAGASTTPYGAKRAALGQTAPWTQVFSKIHLEFGNEEWNSTFQGGSILYNQPYGTQAQVIFGAMQADAAYTSSVASQFDFVLGGQAASPGYNLGVQNFCNNNTSFTIGPYTMNNVTSYSDNESLFGSTFAEPEALMSSASSTSAEGLAPGEVYQNSAELAMSNHNVPLSFYEINLSTTGGTITQTALNSYVSSLGAGLMVADTMLQGLQQYGVVNQNLFSLPQYDFSFTSPTNGTETAYLWGSVIDMGVTDRKRPQFLALELANQALSAGAAMVTTTQTGANPTWNVSNTNTVTFTGAHDIQSYAFAQGTNFSTIVFNLSRTTALPVTFSGTNAPAGTVEMQQLTSTNLTDTNESSQVVGITTSTLTGFSGATGLTLPPYSMTVLTWSSSTAGPAITGVAVSHLTATSAVVTWTTDEAATGQVNYGTTTSYGNSSTLNSSLLTSHTVSLTGLTAGTSYNFAVTSTNSGGVSTSSANGSFTTPLAAPVISSVSVAAVTPTSATITWTTDQASNSQVSYGTTNSYGAATFSSALVTSHTLTVTGLTASTSYNFSVTSANSAGTPASSANMTFSTVSAPVISGVAASNVTANSATITWTTDQTSSSQVLYGPTTSYGGSSTPNSTLVTAHSVTLTGLTQSATYNFQVISTDTYGLSSQSANFTFTTGQQGAVISYVVASAITNNSATISWTTDQASTSQVQYGTTTSYGTASSLNSTLTTTHSVTLTGLTLGTVYDYAVSSTNSTNVAATSGNFMFTTAGGSSSTNIAIGTTTIQPSVKRLGINLGTLTNSDSGQIVRNLITPNPGFEGQVWNSLIQCASGTATSCTDQNTYSSWPAGFWNNATYQVISGAAAGRSGLVSTSTGAGSGVGVTFNFGDSSTAVAAGNYIVVRKTVPGGSSGGWQVTTSSGGSTTDNLTDLPPGTTGKQTIELQAPTASDYATVSTTFDNTSGISFVQLNGTYQLQFKAKALGGSNQIGVTLQRAGGTTFLNQTVVLSNTWNTYNLTFSAAESGAVGGVTLAFSTVYGQDYVELDEVRLTQTNGDPSNTTVFKDGVVNALRTAQPGIIRYWGGNGQLGETLDNLLTPQFGRQRAGYSEYLTISSQIDYGLQEFLVLCQAVGAEPWLVVPATFSSTDAANLIEYLAGTTSTTYGAKRSALGQSTPWTQVFSKIHLEFGEQSWNSNFTGGGITDPATYGAQAQAIFAAMQNDGSYGASASSFDFVLGGQAAQPSNISTIQNAVSNNTSFDIEPYTMNTVNSSSTNELLFGSTFAEPEALMSSSGSAEGLNPGMVYQDYQAIQNSSHVVPLSFSEINLSTLGGSITQAGLNSYVSSLGAGLMVADTMLQGLKQFGVVNQSLYSLPGYQTTRSDGSTVDLFGSVVDMSVTNLRRPQYLALEMANQALSNGATMLQTVHSGANPTWDQPLVNTVYMNGAHYVQSYAFQQGTSFSTVIFNLSRTSPLPVTFSGANAPTGTVEMQQLTSANLTDTNETSNVVQITSSALTSFNDTTGLSLPPYSMTVLTWSTSSGAPAISGVSASGITGTSATINWTTDQASTSQVQYGTTSGYGSSSPLNSTLSTNHSVTLTGLTAGTTYNFDVTSANSASISTTSANSTFSTLSGAPVISSVTASSTSNTAATITWTTDQASNSQVNFGTTTAYGTSVSSSTLVTSHSVALTGLVAGSTYNFDVTSANSAGSPTTSANFTFTAGNPPVISNVTATSITAGSATITWTTDQSTSSLVNYGTTTGYGSASTVNPALSTSHSVTITGLTAGTTYDFDVVSANSVGTYSTSTNYTFTTIAGAPVISAVAVTGITATSATVTWTTDQPTSSLVQYGTTTSYGTTSTLNSALVTSHSVTLSGLTASTTYDFDVVSANSAGTASTSANSAFTTTVVTPVISNVAVTGITTTSATITWTTDQATSSLVNYGLTGSYGSSSALNSTLATSHSVTLSGLTSGTTYNFDVVSANAANTYASSANSTFATTAPTPVISSVTVTAITASSATITWTTDQSTSSLVNYGTTTSYGSTSALNGSLVTSHSVALTGLTAGKTYDFDVVSANSAGTSAVSANSTFTTTAAPPVISSVKVTGITSTSVTVTWTTDQSTSSLVNYGASTTYGSSSTLNSALVTSHSVTLTGLTLGTTYDFDVVSANSVGTSSTSANSTFTTTTPAPVISNVTVSAISGTSATVTWTTDQATSSLVNYGTTTSYGSASTLSSTLVTSHSVTLTGLTVSTTYNFDVVSANSAGTATTSANSTFATSVTAPYVGYVAFWGVNNTGVTISWSTDVNSTTQVAYGTTTALGQVSPLQTTLSASHGVVLTTLNPGTTYYFVCQSTGANGATGYSTTYSFTTTGTASSPAPMISSVSASGLTSTSATITWTTDQASSSQVNYGTTTSYGSSSSLNSTLATSHSVTLTGLSPSTTYDFSVVSANSAGTSSSSANSTFATTAASGTPPVISSVAAGSLTTTSVTITWTTDQASSSLVNYGTTTSYGSSSALSSALVTSHSVTLTGLAAGTAYNFDVVSAIASGATTTSPNSTFSTMATTATPPQVGYVAFWGVNNSGVTISWSTDVIATTQLAYGTTTALGQLTTLQTTLAASHGVTLTGLNPGTTYYFVAQSTGANGATGYSTTYNFTTTGTAATPAPVITSVTATSITSTSATITWTTDQSTSSKVNYGTTTSYGSSTTLDTNMVTSHSETVTGLAPGTTYDFDVVSANSAGTSSTSTNYTFATSTPSGTAPVISSISAASITSTSVTITWTTDQASSSLVNYGTTSTYGSTSALSSTLVTSHSVTLTGLASGTTYNFDVVSAIGTGASSTSSNSTFATTATTATPPYVGYVAYYGISNTGVTISWSTDVNANTQVAYGTTAALGQLTPLQTALTASHGVVLSGLNPGTTYYFVCQSTGANGAIGSSATYSFTTTGTATTPAPVISSVTATSITSTSATLTWTTDQASSSQTNYGTTISYGTSSTVNTALVTSHSVSISGLSPSTTYNFDVVSANSSGISSTSTNSTFTTSAAAPGPVITSVAAGSITNSSAVITWTTDLSSSSQVSYGITTAYGSTTTLNTALVTSHSVTLSGLTAGTTYNFDVISTPSAGTTSTSSNYTFATTGTAPAPVISAVAATGATGSSVTITWTTDQATSSLVNYGTTTAYGSSSTLSSTLVTSHSVTLSGLASGTTYNFDVVSANAASTSSTSSNSSFATTTVTGPAPNVGYVVDYGVTSSGVTISWSTDVAANTVVAYGTTTSLGTLTPVQSTPTTSHGVVLTGLTSGTTYYFMAQSTGSNGVTGYSTTYSFTTVAGPPTISAINVAPATGNTATISWTTSVPTMSYVQYGPTTSYNRYSAQTSLTASPQCALGYVPSGLIHYQLVSTDANGNQVVSPDYTFTEP